MYSVITEQGTVYVLHNNFKLLSTKTLAEAVELRDLLTKRADKPSCSTCKNRSTTKKLGHYNCLKHLPFKPILNPIDCKYQSPNSKD